MESIWGVFEVSLGRLGDPWGCFWELVGPIGEPFGSNGVLAGPIQIVRNFRTSLTLRGANSFSRFDLAVMREMCRAHGVPHGPTEVSVCRHFWVQGPTEERSSAPPFWIRHVRDHHT